MKIWFQQKGARKIWIRLVEYSISKVSDPSEVDVDVDVDVRCPVLVPPLCPPKGPLWGAVKA